MKPYTKCTLTRVRKYVTYSGNLNANEMIAINSLLKVVEDKYVKRLQYLSNQRRPKIKLDKRFDKL